VFAAAMSQLACSVVLSDQTSWLGHSTDELIAAWGEPTSVTNLGEDFVSYEWIDDRGCGRTFSALSGTISGYSETDCN
jgi:hypothetical protein